MSEDQSRPPLTAERIRQIAGQRQALREWADLISPWAFHPNDRLKRNHARLARNYGEMKLRREQNEKSG